MWAPQQCMCQLTVELTAGKQKHKFTGVLILQKRSVFKVFRIDRYINFLLFCV